MKRKLTKVELAELDAVKEEDIDTSDIPELDASFFARAVPMKKHRETVTMRLDEDVLVWFRSQGSGYQTRINAILKMAMEGQKMAGRTTSRMRSATR